jgi:hypothetical protein
MDSVSIPSGERKVPGTKTPSELVSVRKPVVFVVGLRTFEGDRGLPPLQNTNAESVKRFEKHRAKYFESLVRCKASQAIN